MLDFLELEETVGRAWHRLVGGDRELSGPCRTRGRRSRRCAGRIAIMFRALGGETGVQIASASARRTGHRLGWRQRIGLGDERLAQPGRDAATIFLPDRIAMFADRGLNAALYRWLAAWFAFAPVEVIDGGRSAAARSADPAPGERESRACPRGISGACQTDYARLAEATTMARPHRPLPRIEQDMEQIVLTLLGADTPPVGKLWPAMIGDGPAAGRRRRRVTGRSCHARSGAIAGRASCRPHMKATTIGRRPLRRGAIRRSQAFRRPRARGRYPIAAIPFVLNRFEKILAMAEMINVDRPADDGEDEDARKAADDLEEIALSQP